MARVTFEGKEYEIVKRDRIALSPARSKVPHVIVADSYDSDLFSDLAHGDLVLVLRPVER